MAWVGAIRGVSMNQSIFVAMRPPMLSLYELMATLLCLLIENPPPFGLTNL